MKKIVIVDADDNEIGAKSFSELDLQHIIFRVSAVWISNAEGEVLLAQRTHEAPHSPGAWGPSAAGTIEVGETYDSNIVKETEEELGIAMPFSAFTKGPKIFSTVPNPKRQYFTQWYYATVDKQLSDFDIQEDEVAAIRWVPRENILEELTEKPDDFIEAYQEIIKLIP
ncbi:MAG: isopentenyldiphosphate isomerase [Candidatus Azotimanducaceae bacterium]|jgi:isopentenyldiphosphate isomerase